MAQFGRISGKLLSDNLIRHGVDLVFDNDLLYFKVSPEKQGTPSTNDPETDPQFPILSEPPYSDGDPNWGFGSPGTGIGINTDNPIFDLDVNSDIKTLSALIDSATIDNITFAQPATIGTVTGPINLFTTGTNSTAIFDILQAGNISFDENIIENFIANENLIISANGTGDVQLQSNTAVTGNLSVSGNIKILGDLSTTSNIIIGDDPLDVVVFGTSMSQDINPGKTLEYDLGSVTRRWRAAYIPDWTTITNILPSSAIVNDTMFLGGPTNNILALEPNQELLINPDVNSVVIENLRFQDNNISNLLNSPLTLATVGIGYYRFAGDSGVVLPSGTSAQRPATPNVGDTRWNTELQYLECFDGSVYITAIGPGDTVEVQDMEDLSNIYTLILG